MLAVWRCFKLNKVKQQSAVCATYVSNEVEEALGTWKRHKLEDQK